MASSSINEKNIFFINLIESRECIYKNTCPDYPNKVAIDMAWREIAESTQWTVSDCMEKWRNLRHSFVRSLRNPNKQYYLHNQMQFLMPYIKKNANTSIDVESTTVDKRCPSSSFTENERAMCSTEKEICLRINIEPPLPQSSGKNKAEQLLLKFLPLMERVMDKHYPEVEHKITGVFEEVLQRKEYDNKKK
ncbi:uncharacterized protein LOC129910242 [Episyrphus balteatus]|uniref:uncharacterized protein LOC129910242 n=1 Tax=Episyrphus balteatus TaxID=286459 RepID=UPI0024854F2C|nr:uncharacterized protein LOC129910242 [Episyrphus balteatus]